MELTLEQYERIQKYADGEMSPEEEDAFLEEISHNEEMQDSLDLEFALRKDVVAPPEENKIPGRFDDPAFIRSLMEKAGSEKSENETLTSVPHSTNHGQREAPVIKFNFFSTIAVAATIILAVSLIFWQISKNSPTEIVKKDKEASPARKDSLNPERRQIMPVPERSIDYAALYNEAYEKDKIPGKIPQRLEDALFAYEDGNYRKLSAYDLYNLPEARGDEPADESPQRVRELGHYYKGIALIESKKAEQAKTDFNWVIKNAKNAELAGKARWYLALLNIKEGKKEEAIVLLKDVAANTRLKPYSSNATKLLESLQ